MPPGDGGAALAIVVRTLEAAIDTHRRVREQDLTQMMRAASSIVEALEAGGKVLAFGNGGSAGDAQHLVAELVGRFQKERAGFAAVALTADTSLLTSVANDYGFERVFGRQVEAFGRPGDVAVGISTSGRSPNIVDGLRTARARGLTTIAVAGASAAEMAPHADLVLAVAGPSTARIQEGHLTVLHVICDLVESALVASEPPASR